ncbi:MFS transporter [Oxalobacteraceae bacterium]|nr:MFS transporter [Oxalobacteraceae bacterium]
MHSTLKSIPAETQIIQVAKPRMSFWQIWNMSFGFLGVQFGLALQNANMSRIFQTLGVDPDKLAILWIAAPLTGLLVQPIIGYMSDRTWGRWGRRRPYFVAGAVLASLALIGMPNSGVLWVAAGILWVQDASINIAMEPFRAFVGDLLPKDQVTKGYAFQTFFIGVGAVVASALPYVLTNWFHVANTAPAGVIPDSVTYSFYLGAIVFFGAVMWTVVRTKEYSPEQMAQFHPEMESSGEHVSSGIAGFFRDFLNMPKVMMQLSVVQFFTWFTWFAMWTYATTAFTQHIYHTSDTSSALYNEGANWWGVCGAVYSGSSALFAFLLPMIAARTSRKAAHAISLAIGGLSFISIYFISTPDLLILSFLGVGVAWASTLSMPYAILACTIPAKKMGMYMGMFNISIAIPQAAAGLGLGFFLTHFFEGKAVMVLVLGGVSMLVAAALSLWVKEVD